MMLSFKRHTLFFQLTALFSMNAQSENQGDRQKWSEWASTN